MLKAVGSKFTWGILALCLSAPNIHAEEKLYRYVDNKGVKVISRVLPPEYAQKGYEILSLNGQLIRKVEAAPTDGDIAAENKRRLLREQYAILKRRYSTLDDIESAKLRRLENINTNISILRGNISSINIRIENLMNDAAEMERAGREVTATLLQKLMDTRAELAVAESALATRLEEYNRVSERFDQDLATFIEGSKLIDNMN